MDKKKIAVFVAFTVLFVFLIAVFLTFHQKNSSLVIYGNVDIREVNLGFRVGGRLQTVKVDEGDQVRAGQLLATLDPEPYEREVEGAKAGVNQQKASLDYATTVYLREKSLRGSGASSTNNYQHALSQYEQAKANLAKADSQLAEANLRLQDTHLVAPTNGVVLTRVVEPGSVLPPNISVLSVSLTNPVWVRAYVSEINLSQVKPGTSVQIISDSIGKALTGKIGFVSSTAEFTPKTVESPDLRTQLVYRVRIIVDDPQDALRQGMPVTIKF